MRLKKYTFFYVVYKSVLLLTKSKSIKIVLINLNTAEIMQFKYYDGW